MEETGLTCAIQQKNWCEGQREQTTMKAGAVPPWCNSPILHGFSGCSEAAAKG